MSSRDHGCMRVVCPFCPKEKLFKRLTPELKEHVASHHPTDLKDLGEKDKTSSQKGMDFGWQSTQKTISGTRNAHRYELGSRRQKSQDIGETSGEWLEVTDGHR